MFIMDKIMAIFAIEPGPWTIPDLARRLGVCYKWAQVGVIVLVAQGDLEPAGKREGGHGMRPMEYQLAGLGPGKEIE